MTIFDRMIRLKKLNTYSCFTINTKRIVLFVLTGHLLFLSGQAQTGHSHRKENFDVNRFQVNTISIPKPESSMILTHISNITVMDVRVDTSRVGLMQKTVVGSLSNAGNNGTKNPSKQFIARRPTFVILNNGLRKASSEFVNRYLILEKNDSFPGILMVIKKFWLSDELNLNNNVRNNERISSNFTDQWTSGVDIKIEFYLRYGKDYYALYRYDSVISKPMTISEYGHKFIALALMLSLDRMQQIENKISTITTHRKFTLEEINLHNNDAYNIPVLKDTMLRRGVYMTFEEFKNNNPSQTDFELKKDKLSDIIYIKQPDGKEYVTRDIWGYCDAKNSFVKSADNFFLLQRLENAFYIFGAKNLKGTVVGGTSGDGFFYSNGSSFYVPQGNGNNVKFNLLLEPFLLDWDNGKLY